MLKRSEVGKRFCWTIFFVFIYVLGSHLVLPFIDLKHPKLLGGLSNSIAFTSAMMGGNLSSFSLFSVGLSPWMSAMILWQMFSFSKKSGLSKLPIEIQDRRKMYLTFAIALIQSLAVSLSLPIEVGIGYPNEHYPSNCGNLLFSLAIGFEFFLWYRRFYCHFDGQYGC